MAAPVAGLAEPYAVFAGIGDGGYPTFEGTAGQAVLDGALWVDLGPVGQGHYVASVSAYEITGVEPGGAHAAQPRGWLFALVVGDAP